MRLILMAIVGAGVWFSLGEPKKQVANWLYPDEAAPWEKVDGFFYPNKHDLSDPSLATVAACRDWAAYQADEGGDAFSQRSDYECGVGKSEQWNDLHVYRLIAK